MAVDNINEQNPATVNQIKSERPNVPKSISRLEGYIANSMNAGHNRVIAFKKVMAGEKIRQADIELFIQTLTPLTPAYQELRGKISCYYVPNSRVWTNAEKYTAQKGGNTAVKIAKIPCYGAYAFPNLEPDETSTTLGVLGVNIQHTTDWRDSFAACYIPRFGYNNFAVNEIVNIFPRAEASILPLRGRVAIFNDFERNKEYDSEEIEYKSDTVTQAEWNNYMPTNPNRRDFYEMRAKRPNSYYTDYRTSYQGFAGNAPNVTTDNAYRSYVTWADWESKIAEARAQANNSQKNDWEIISELRGSKKLTEGKVQLIGERNFKINYSAITQNTYNTYENNEDNRLSEEFQVMGKQGAYSFTNIKMPIVAGYEAREEGYLHVILTVYADSVFESAMDRNEMNITPLDEYRPDLLDDKLDVLYEGECGNIIYNEGGRNVLGYKRKYSEYFKLPNVIAGDMTSLYYRETEIDGNNTTDYTNKVEAQTNVITQKTYQFFETSRFTEAQSVGDSTGYEKKVWKDYTDLMLNKNQVIQNKIQQKNGAPFKIKGQNQIFFVGKLNMLNDLPIDESIKSNYSTWGEH